MTSLKPRIVAQWKSKVSRLEYRIVVIETGSRAHLFCERLGVDAMAEPRWISAKDEELEILKEFVIHNALSSL